MHHTPRTRATLAAWAALQLLGVAPALAQTPATAPPRAATPATNAPPIPPDADFDLRISERDMPGAHLS